MNDMGFYNKYILMSNSYQINYLVRKVVKNNKNKCNVNLNKLIEKEIKNKLVTKKKVKFKNVNENTSKKINNPVKMNKSIKTINFERNFFYGTSKSSLSNRIKNN